MSVANDVRFVGVKQTCPGSADTSVFDPTATLGGPNDNPLDAGFLAIKVLVLAAKSPSPEGWVSAVRSSGKQNNFLA